MTEPIRQAATPKTSHRILIVDDDERLLKLYVLVLKDALPTCSLELAVNGAEAIASFRQTYHDLVVMDVRMPVMDGEQAFKEMLAVCQTSNRGVPPIIFCTGFDVSETLQRAVDLNPQHSLMMKPIRGAELVERIRSRLLISA